MLQRREMGCNSSYDDAILFNRVALEICVKRPKLPNGKKHSNSVMAVLPPKPPKPQAPTHDDSVAVAERVNTKPPPMYRVLLLNDDYTPMDFVVGVLQSVFAMTREQATQVMLQVHRAGMGTCGVFTKEIADTKVAQVVELAAAHQHPLQCTMEPN
jgi:ATP-dependent Clp protease adaptor protein ClpS